VGRPFSFNRARGAPVESIRLTSLFGVYGNVLAMQGHCLRNAFRVNKMAETTGFTVTLPNQLIEMIEKDLVPTGLYGNNRAEAARYLIVSRLEQLMAQGIVRIRRDD
jgi:hypothetical protein